MNASRYLIPDGWMLRGPVSVRVALPGDGRRPWVYVDRAHRCGLTEENSKVNRGRLAADRGGFSQYSQSVCRPSRRCSQRCNLSAQTALWRGCAGTRSLAFRRSPSAARIAGRWPSPLHDSGTDARCKHTLQVSKCWSTILCSAIVLHSNDWTAPTVNWGIQTMMEGISN